MAVPTPITGGCLCGNVRYEIKPTPDHDYKKDSHTCQCTQCRKQAGSLVLHLHNFTSSEVTWLSKSTLGDYNASPGRHRFFCRSCGSWIAWQDDALGGDIEFCVGTFDEEFLIGKRDGQGKPMGTSWGMRLASPEGHNYYAENEIRGVTDELRGSKFLHGIEGEPLN